MANHHDCDRTIEYRGYQTLFHSNSTTQVGKCSELTHYSTVHQPNDRATFVSRNQFRNNPPPVCVESKTTFLLKPFRCANKKAIPHRTRPKGNNLNLWPQQIAWPENYRNGRESPRNWNSQVPGHAPLSGSLREDSERKKEPPAEGPRLICLWRLGFFETRMSWIYKNRTIK